MGLRFPTSRRLLVPTVAVLGLVLVAPLPMATSAAPDRDEAERAPNADQPAVDQPEDFLPESLAGREAFNELANRIPEAAALNDMETSELSQLLLGDETATIDPSGRLHYLDPPATAKEKAAGRRADAASATTASRITEAEAFTLHSKPGADRKIFLDFDGATITDSYWQTTGYPSLPNPLVAPAWDIDGDAESFSSTELERIQQVWQIVAEDYAPFDVDVTTEDPGTAGLIRSSAADTTYGSHALISPSADAYSTICPDGCGGVAYVGVFDEVNSTLQPAWTFPQGTGNSAKNIAEATSHEVGHNLNLRHDGTATLGYYSGHSNWAPIMGVGYNKAVAQFSQGDYSGANQSQDDIAIIDGYLGLRTDEAPTTSGGAIEPTSETGYISSRTDVDTYSLIGCQAGDVITASAADLAPNLDVELTLSNAAGPVATNDPNSGSGDGVTATGMSASVAVPADGDYFVAVDGVGTGSPTTGYDDYGSLGAYTIDVLGCEGEPAEGTPGAPIGLTATPASNGTDVALTWSAPTDVGDGVDGYTVTVVGGDSVDAGSATSYTVTGLSQGTEYTFRVNGYNTVGAGPVASATATTPTTVPGEVQNLTATYDAANQRIPMSWSAPADTGGSAVSGYQIFYDGSNLGTTTGTAVNITNVTTPDHTVGVRAVNASGAGPLVTVETMGDASDAPDNDDVADAEVITGESGTTDGTTLGATDEGTDPTPPGSGSGGYSVWYSWTPTDSGEVTFTTSSTDSARDTTLAAYTGAIGSLGEVAANDDFGGGTLSQITFTATAGTRYLLAVDGWSYSADAVGPFTLAWTQTPEDPATVPDAPTGVTGVPGDGSVTVFWSEPASDGGSAITGYTVTASPGGATATSTSVRNAVVSGLDNGTAYTFTVVATNAVGDSDPSSPSSAVTPRTVPDAPTSVSATAGDGAADVSWTAPADDGGSAVMSYTVTASPGGATQSVIAPATSTAFSGLSNGTEYTFTVVATNLAGDSEASEASNAVTPVAPATVPDAPTDVSATAGDGSAEVSWTAPANDGGAEVSGYTVTASPGGATATVDGETTSATVGSLSNGTEYTFTVVATNAVGDSVASAASNAVTPVAPLTVPDAPTDASAVAGDASADVSWTAPADDGGAEISGYTVTASPGGATASTSGSTSATVTGLSNGTEYTFTVVATNSVGDSEASEASNAVTPVAPATVPDAPTDVSATAGDGSAEVSWTAPPDDGGAEVTGYTVTASPGGAIATVDGDSTSATVNALSNGTEYTFTVVATNAVGDSEASAASNAVTPVAPVTVPDAPTGVEANAGDGSADVSWTAPADDGGAEISGYTVTASPGGATASTSGATSARVTGLANGTEYTFTVVATNAVGDSEASGASNAVTPVAPATVPDAPTDVTARAGDGLVSLDWSAATPNGTPVTGYRVTTIPSGAVVDVSGLSATVDGLTNGDSYVFAVQALSAAGISEAGVSQVVVPAGAPSRPIRVKAKLRKKGTRVLVKWRHADANGSAVTSYLVRVSRGSNAVVKGNRVLLKKNLKPGKHVIRVRAFNSVGRSAFSKKVVVRTRR